MRLLDASPQTQASQGFDEPFNERPVGGSTSRMPPSVAKIYPIKGGCYAARGMERGKSSFEARHNKKPTSMLERLDQSGRKRPRGYRLQNSHQENRD